ncbi:MAG: efflux RND transporter permease subunit [Bacteroidales bacterium]|nr:efflux RND transporter permease subunit [Bacteroidales bacterium]
MLDSIIGFSLRNRLAVLLAAVLLVIGGLYVSTNMEVDVFPDLNAPTVVIMTEANGMAPEEVEKIVTFPIETAVNGATDVRRVRSSSTTGFSVVWVEFDWGTDIYRARQIVSEKLAAVSEQLPSNVGNPTLGPQSSILGEVLIIGLTANGETDMEQLRTLADWTIRPQLLATGGVAQVAVLGGDIKEYQILLDLEKMRRFGISVDDVLRATDDMNRNAAGGVLYEYSNEYIIRGMTSTTNIEDIERTVVSRVSKHPVTLRDIAEVKIGPKEPRMGAASVEGKPAVILTVTKQPNVSTKELTANLDSQLAGMAKTLPADIDIKTDIFRQSSFIDASIGNIKKALLEGAFFVVLVLFLFLLNIRTTVISLVTIPLAMLITIIVLRLTGMSINTMSIGGMAIAIGSLVDDAIVDVENVYKRLRENHALPVDRRRKVLDVVFDASREVRMPILNSTFIIVASFVPLFFLSGIEGRMLIPLGIAFIVSLFASTFVALTLTPVLCSFLLKNTGSTERSSREPAFTRWLKGIYGRGLNWALNHGRTVIGVSAAFLVLAVVMMAGFGRSFLPAFNEGSFTINVGTLPGVSLEESDNIGRRTEELILSVPEIQTVARKTGRAELDEHALGVNASELEAPFKLDKRSKDEVIAELREKLGSLPGVNVEIGQPISHRIDAMLSGTQSAIAIKIFGTDLNRMFTLGNEIKAAVADIPGVEDLNVEQQIERPELLITPRREMLARYGISPAELAEFVEVCLGGRAISQVYEDGKVFDLTVKASGTYRDRIETIKDMTIDTPDGKVPLSWVADIRSAAGPNTINRENAQRKIVVSANVSGGDLQGTVDAMQDRIAERVELPEGYRIEFGGQFESAQSATRTLAITTLFALIVIFLLLYGQFKSFSQSAIVLIDLPLALIGGVLTIFFSDGILSIPAIIGFISLFGIATRNGMLLIDRYNDLRAGGMSLRDAVSTGSLDRLNPIIMTALTSALALVPLVIGSDLPGNEIQSPMAKVLLGGLISSTLLNGFVIPVVYSLVSSKTEKKDETE